MKINRQNLKLMPLRLMVGAGLIMASFLSEASAVFDCTRLHKCNRNWEKCKTDDYFNECKTSCPIKEGKDPIEKCTKAHEEATLPSNIIKDAIKAPCEARQSFIDMEEQVSRKMGRTPYSKKEKEFILTGCKEGDASSKSEGKEPGRPLSLPEEVLQKRENLNKIGSPDRSKKTTPSSVPLRQRSASPTHVTQQAAAKGSAEDLKEQLKRSDFTMLGSLSKGKTPDQILDIIKQKPELFTEKEKVVKYLEKLKEEEGATPPDYAPPLPPSSVETAPPPKHGVVSLPPPLRVPPQNNAPQNVQ